MCHVAVLGAEGGRPCSQPCGIPRPRATETKPAVLWAAGRGTPAPRRPRDDCPLSSDAVRGQEGPLSCGCSAPLCTLTPHRQWTEQLQAPASREPGGPLPRSSQSPGRAQAPEEGPAGPPAARGSSSARVRWREAVALRACSSRTGSAASSRDLLVVTAGTGALLAARGGRQGWQETCDSAQDSPVADCQSQTALGARSGSPDPG